MFELEKQSVFFEGLAKEHPMLLQNIEIVYENKLSLDASYHSPKQFIFNLNNTLRALVFFFEQSIKNTPSWLKTCVENYRDENRNDYEMLKRLRDLSAHQALIFPKESIVTGLFRVKSSENYLPKIGMGDFNKSGNYSWDLAMRNTEDVFHDLLVFQSMTFMDLEHSAHWECLGVARRWFYHVKHRGKGIDQIVDVYKLTADFSTKLLDHVCNSYAALLKLKNDFTFHKEFSEFNCINTLLEIDLYPSLFSEWWEFDATPLNWGVRINKSKGEFIEQFDKLHRNCYDNLCNSPEMYKILLEKYRDISYEHYFAEENVNEFLSFIHINHWHFKNSFEVDLLTSPISPSEVMMLQRLGKIFLDEYNKDKLCTIASTGKNFKEHLSLLFNKI